MIILKYSLAIFCLLLTGCSFFSSHKEKESTPLMEYEQTTEDIKKRDADTHYELFPFSQTQLEQNEYLKQNPGW